MLNKAIIMGRITTDPELKHTTSNFAVTNFQIAVDRSYVKPGAERQTDFITIVAWRNTAEFICKYFKKGSMIVVDGSIQTRSYTDSQGAKRTAVEVLADNVYFGESKKETPLDAVVKAAESAGVDVNRGDFATVPSDDDLPF